MFTGFEDSTFEFFMALSYNNNREFFHSNHDWYERAVRDPLRELTADLAPVLLKIDPDIEVRPAKVISHINRDLRYSRDKSPYRDYMWLGFHKAGWNKQDCFHLYFDISAEGAHCGAAMYGADRLWMENLRRAIRENTDEARKVLLDPRLKQFKLGGERLRRISRPECVDAALAEWYDRRYLFLERDIAIAECRSAELVAEVASYLKRLKRLYNFMFSIRPDRSAPPEEDTFERMQSGTFYSV